MRKIGYLGPRGTFSDQAALQYLGEEQAELVPCNTLEDVCRSVIEGICSEGILPIENLIEGSVNPVLDLLLETPQVTIQAEFMLPVAHYLLAPSERSLSEIKTVLSHPQALSQCRQYLANHLPQAILVPVESTALAAKRLVEEGGHGMAAIAPLASANRYGLAILDKNIQDQPHNCTRFVVIGTEPVPMKNDTYKTSLAVSAIDCPGALHSILKEFAWQGINLTRIESRPAKTYLGEYIFYIDLEGHRCQPEVAEVLQKLADESRGISILGSYPASRRLQGQEPEPSMATLQSLRSDIDLIDRQLVQLLGKRLKLVKRVGELEQQQGSVKEPSPPKEQQVQVAAIRQLAVQQGLSPDVVEKSYRLLLDYFVQI
ncbi:prephenate dehydratase [Desulforamulus aeronauticus]|uniref:Prephenate dehydratase n=1 Tax=Desulforamulus aeronauticus DSM 10349 TaxID=1121421 RepID=A0A1M6PGW2_9FIRM|nr:prephenate dehydratase [Desulforamulus aeronauticus]SHK07130.1 prephenate dehydratase [Desulforamulus aeronauticus DSM 10349]